jgi:hypothetical protein
MKQELKEQLARIRKSQNRVVMSEFIRIATSDLYDFNPGVRATLREIALLQVTKEDASVPEESPFKGDYIGWCWMSQKNLALRVGKSESQVHRDIQKFEKDGVIAVRSWRDSNGNPHNEYHVIEQVVQDHQRPEDKDAPRPKRNKRVYKSNKGSFSAGNQPKSHTASQALPYSMSAVATQHVTRSHTASQPSSHTASHEISTDEMPLKGVALEGFKFLEGFDLPVTTASARASAVPPSAGTGRDSVLVDEEREPKTSKGSIGFKQDKPVAVVLKASTVEVLGAEARQKQQQSQNQKPSAAITKGEKKPLPNRLCYPELFKGRIGPKGEWLGGKLPRCRRCAAILFPEENHDCPGYLEGGESHLGEYVYHPIAPKGTTLHDPEDRLTRREASYDDWDDDHYDRTTEGNIDRDPDAEESGVVMGVEEAE